MKENRNMNIAIPLHQFQLHNVFFMEKKRNVVIDGVFIKIMYSDEHIELTELYIAVKNREEDLKKVMTIESEIINQYCNRLSITKSKTCMLHKHFIEHKHESEYVMKISGIWETNTNVGITCKFIRIS
jgi:hypothetical protein